MSKYILVDELKENFKVIKTQICEPENSITIEIEPQCTYDKAVVEIIKKLKELGYTELTLPMRPPPIIIVIDEDNYLPIITLIK